MKNYTLRSLCAIALLIPMFWACQKERLSEDIAHGPSVAALSIDEPCSPAKTISLADASENTLVDVCVVGGVGVPCTTTTPWGSVTYTKYPNPSYPNSTLVLEVNLAPGYFATGYSVVVSPPGPIVTVGNVPLVTTSWTTQVLNPNQNSFLVSVDLLPELYGSSCFEWSIAIDAQRFSFNGLPIPGTQRTLYAYDPNGAGSTLVIDDCYEGCPLPETSETQGTCQGCRAQVSVTYAGCAAVTVSSCKTIQQVVIVYDDCSREYHDNLSVNTVTYNAFPAGHVISHVFVRSGCRANTGPAAQDNIDTNGNSYPNVRRFQFNGPCFNSVCN
jgi:hypothetical protein